MQCKGGDDDIDERVSRVDFLLAVVVRLCYRDCDGVDELVEGEICGFVKSGVDDDLERAPFVSVQGDAFGRFGGSIIMVGIRIMAGIRRGRRLIFAERQGIDRYWGSIFKFDIDVGQDVVDEAGEEQEEGEETSHFARKGLASGESVENGLLCTLAYYYVQIVRLSSPASQASLTSKITKTFLTIFV